MHGMATTCMILCILTVFFCGCKKVNYQLQNVSFDVMETASMKTDNMQRLGKHHMIYILDKIVIHEKIKQNKPRQLKRIRQRRFRPLND
jgi:hypothetical protein